jgi:hypothetical protein
MQHAGVVSAREMAVLRPGLDRVREKVNITSMRQTTREEDIAYSLLGIFNGPIPVMYGDGVQAVSRFLEHARVTSRLLLGLGPQVTTIAAHPSISESTTNS